jgi:hypothetical protein
MKKEVLNKVQMMQAIQQSASNGQAHYVYGLCRGDSLELFYIGKGINSRVFDHESKQSLSKNDNSYKNNIIKKHGVGGYVFFDACETAKEAFSKERDLIAQIGIKNLANIGRGGEGQDPVFASEFAKKQWADPNSKIRQATSTDEFKKKLSIANKEAQNRPEVKAKHAASMAKVMPQIAAKLRENYKNPEARKAAGNGNRGRVQSDAEKAQRAIAVKEAYKNPELRKSQSELLKKISSTPEMREKRRLASLARWAKPGAKEAHQEMLKRNAANKEISLKISSASKERWKDAEYRNKCIKNLKRA